VINKGHLKYETTTLTLGNISSVEQLVPPLSLWKGVPGAASLCPASFQLPLPHPACLRRPGEETEGTHQGQQGRGGQGWPSVGSFQELCERLGVIGKKLKGDWRSRASVLWGFILIPAPLPALGKP
jgi:hypothetical protein